MLQISNYRPVELREKAMVRLDWMSVNKHTLDDQKLPIVVGSPARSNNAKPLTNPSEDFHLPALYKKYSPSPRQHVYASQLHAKKAENKVRLVVSRELAVSGTEIKQQKQMHFVK